jgi:hypothetical protein
VNDGARELIEEIFQNPQLGYRISAVVNNGRTEDIALPNVAVYDKSVNIKDILVGAKHRHGRDGV